MEITEKMNFKKVVSLKLDQINSDIDQMNNEQKQKVRTLLGGEEMENSDYYFDKIKTEIGNPLQKILE